MTVSRVNDTQQHKNIPNDFYLSKMSSKGKVQFLWKRRGWSRGMEGGREGRKEGEGETRSFIIFWNESFSCSTIVWENEMYAYMN